MRTRVSVALAVTVTVLLGASLLVPPQEAEAHPLGNFTVSRYSRLELTPGLARLRYVVDMAEIPTFQERAAIDADRDGRIADAEADAYAERQAEQIRRNIRLTVDGRQVDVRLTEREIAFPEGQGGLETLRLGLWFEAPLPPISGAISAEYRDDNFADRLGWREIVVRGGPGIDLSGATVPDADISDELRSYPEDMLQRPLDRREARFSFAPGAGKPLDAASTAGATVTRGQDRFAALIARDLTLPVILVSLLVAMGLGALHALGPGHGKTVVAAYLVGSRGTTKHAVFLGLTVTLTHTSSVFALGLVTLYLSEFILPEQLFPWLSFLSGAGIAALGVGLLWSRTRTLLRRRAIPAQHHHHGDPPTPAHVHAHATLQPPARARMRHHTAEPGHVHGQDHGHSHAHAHEHEHDSSLHSHGGRVHSHLPPGTAGERVTWKSLLALGISGGILPCPSALVVLLTAISLHRVGYGMLLIFAFSVGLAGVLTGIGLLLVHARGLFRRLPLDSAVARITPVLSAAVVTALGAVIAFRALAGYSTLSI